MNQTSQTKPGFIKPFRIGDVVRFKKVVCVGYRDRYEHVIHKVNVNTVNEYEYSTHLGSWYSHRNLELVRECDEASLKVLIKSNEDEEE